MNNQACPLVLWLPARPDADPDVDITAVGNQLMFIPAAGGGTRQEPVELFIRYGEGDYGPLQYRLLPEVEYLLRTMDELDEVFSESGFLEPDFETTCRATSKEWASHGKAQRGPRGWESVRLKQTVELVSLEIELTIAMLGDPPYLCCNAWQHGLIEARVHCLFLKSVWP